MNLARVWSRESRANPASEYPNGCYLLKKNKRKDSTRCRQKERSFFLRRLDQSSRSRLGISSRLVSSTSYALKDVFLPFDLPSAPHFRPVLRRIGVELPRAPCAVRLLQGPSAAVGVSGTSA